MYWLLWPTKTFEVFNIHTRTPATWLISATVIKGNNRFFSDIHNFVLLNEYIGGLNNDAYYC